MNLVIQTTKTILAVNLRPQPSTKQTELLQIPAGEEVGLIPLPTVYDGTYTWQAVVYKDKYGWCITRNLASVTPTPTPVKSTIFGLHYLPGGANPLEMAKRLHNAGKRMGAVTVVNDKGLANALVPYVDKVIYRNVSADGNPDNFKPDADGFQWAKGLFPKYDGLDAKVYVQLANEPVWTSQDNQIWFDAMSYANSIGRKLAILSYAVGNPSENNYMEKWMALQGALTFAKDSGHLVNLHVYSAEGTSAGHLSSANLLPYYEGRPFAMYAKMPASAQPDLVLSEAACEFTRGKFQGVENCITWSRELYVYATGIPYLKGFCLWTVGGQGQGWADASIDSALPQLENLFRGSL